MKKILFFMLITLITIFADNKGDEMIKLPVCKKIPKELTIHNDTRIDNYYWLNDRDNPDVIEYLNKENEYTDKSLAHTKDLQEKLFNELKGRIKQDDSSVPYKKNGYWYYVRFEEGKEYPIYCRKKESLDNEEQILLDVNNMAKGFDYYHVTGLKVSPDHKFLVFGVDNVSRRKYTLHFKEIATGKILEKKIENTTGSASWANDGKTIFFSRKDEALRAAYIMRYNMDSEKTDEIFFEDDETYSSVVYKSKSDKYIIISSGSTVADEYRILDAVEPYGEFKIFKPRKRGIEYSIEHYKDKFYIVTNYEAQNFRLMETDENNTNIENWKEVIPHRDDVLLEDIEVFDKYLVVEERENGLTNLRIIGDEKDEYIKFPDPAYVTFIGTNPEFDSDELRFFYSSLTTPNSVYDYNLKSGEMTLKKQDEVLNVPNMPEFKPENYKSERFFITARDGEKVPVSLVYSKDTKLDGTAPLLLYAYGSYGYSTDPFFSPSRLSLLDRGFVYAIAHIRGGEEMGRKWYEDGKMLNKKNTFYDFIDVADYLSTNNYTSKDRLYAMGGSAGGLLIGSVINMSPESFAGAVAIVPFVDVVTTMLDESIPLTTGEYDEWGNPNDKEYYEYMLSYSPYDNVEAKDYPALLVTTGLHDSQVQYWEPAKWVAKLRDMKTDDNPLYLQTDMSTGHGGASGRFEKYKLTALHYAFIMDLAGVE